jgi:hypothetical protein
MESDRAGAVRERWVAGGSMPARLGYCNASSGLVVLELAGSRLSLRLRPKLMAKFLGVNTLPPHLPGLADKADPVDYCPATRHGGSDAGQGESDALV